MSIQSPKENIDLLQELDAGVFAQKLARALADVALGVVTTGKTGKVTMQIDMKQIANGSQINMDHKLLYVKPTGNGKATEENTTSTAVYVGSGGKLTLLPDRQNDFFRNTQKEETE